MPEELKDYIGDGVYVRFDGYSFELRANDRRRKAMYTAASERQTQCKDVLDHLTRYGRITSLTMFRDYGIIDGRRRICDLRERGYDIHAEYEMRKTRRGRPVRIAIYYYTPGEQRLPLEQAQ
jgi:hypothetical protein